MQRCLLGEIRRSVAEPSPSAAILCCFPKPQTRGDSMSCWPEHGTAGQTESLRLLSSNVMETQSCEATRVHMRMRVEQQTRDTALLVQQLTANDCGLYWQLWPVW